MGLFGGKKTSTDYLKEIAKAQKEQVSAAKDEARAARIEAEAQANIANAEARLEEARAATIEEANFREQMNYNKIALKECQNELKQFYSQFEYNITDIGDIERKCLNIIRWIDTVDRKFKNSPTQFQIGENQFQVVYNDDKSKYQTLMKLLHEAVDFINSSSADKKHFEYIIGKLNYYNEREKNEKETKRRRRNRILLILLYILLLGGIITTILLVIPYPKTNDDDCKALIYKNIENGNLQKAKKYVLDYRGSKDDIYDGVYKLITAFIECGDLEQAIKTFDYLETDWNGKRGTHAKLSRVFIEQGLYEKAFQYWWKIECLEECIIHMCKNEQFNEARKYLKQVSLKIEDKKERAEWVQEMNQLINSYL